MLRWLVLGLLLCNAVYFVWHHNRAVSAVINVPMQAAPSSEGDRLVLLSERKSGALTQAATPAEPAIAICHMIGPFKEKISAHQVQDRLRALDITVNTYQVNIPDKPDFWVYLGPMRSRKEALDMLRELQNKKVDSFLIGDGDLVNGISLGFFTKEPLAQAVLKQRREQGYDAKLRAVPRFTEELWEVFAEGQYAKFSDELWLQIKAGTQGVELRKNSCDLIASAEKLD
ncbi:MAG: SPOR domain-containing protein [Spongiibacteraceae bacterium]